MYHLAALTREAESSFSWYLVLPCEDFFITKTVSRNEYMQRPLARLDLKWWCKIHSGPGQRVSVESQARKYWTIYIAVCIIVCIAVCIVCIAVCGTTGIVLFLDFLFFSWPTAAALSSESSSALSFPRFTFARSPVSLNFYSLVFVGKVLFCQSLYWMIWRDTLPKTNKQWTLKWLPDLPG